MCVNQQGVTTGTLGADATFDCFSSFDCPEYRICREDALELVGGDELLAERILDGTVVLDEMPKELQGPLAETEERAKWVRAQADAYFAKLKEAQK